MLLGRAHRGLLLKVDHPDGAPVRQPSGEVPGVGLPIRDVVPGVNRQNAVDRRRAEPRVGGPGEDHVDRPEPVLLRHRVDAAEHRRFDVDGQDPPPGLDRPGEMRHEIPGPGPQIGDSHALRDAHRLQDRGGLLPVVPRRVGGDESTHGREHQRLAKSGPQHHGPEGIKETHRAASRTRSRAQGASDC